MTGRAAAPTALLAASMGALTLAGCNDAATTAAPVSAPAQPVPQDQWGGVAMGVGSRTGYFQVAQVGDRWMFVTPEGNGLWMLGVFGVIYSDSVDDLGSSGHSRVMARYGNGADWQNKWRQHTAQRLKAWGFNTLAEYHHWAMRPGPLPDPNAVRLPYIHIAKPAFYGLDNRYGYGRGPFKDLIHATDPQYYTGYRGGQSPDVFDPNFEAYVDGWMRNDDGLKYGNIGNPWMLGISMDDADNLFGFGPGPELPAARVHPHLGWITLVTDFEQSGSPWVASYADPRVYSKYALRDFLAARYGSVAALNAAWGASYSSFDSQGGWGQGTGLLDENGRHPWVGNERDEMAGAAAAVKADLDAFLYEYAKRYFTVMAGKMRQYAPRHLVFGPASFNGWGGLTRKEILKAAGETVDVVQCALSSPEALTRTARYVGNKPLVTWDTFVANPDSALWRYPVPREQPPWPPQASNQEDRGRLYAQKMDLLFGARSGAGPYVVAGMKFWSYGDHWGEKMNFGLVTFSENAYDGREAVAARGTDPWAYPTGGEERSYGDFLSAVRNANLRVQEQLARYGRSASVSQAQRDTDPVGAPAAP
ncbi:MAG: hypothetical protein DMF80_06195 [Acidobacteria bacterium]|nr:MAG: hypothetical protein DMF80_06195 [Acidobacteriota bacterium]